MASSTPSATAIFRWIESHNMLVHERHEVGCPIFADLRLAMNAMITQLAPEDVEPELSWKFRRPLLSWLTTPVLFANLDPAVLDELGASGDISQRWGKDMYDAYEAAGEAFARLRTMDNPLREALSEELGVLLAEKQRVRVFCHRTSISHFETLEGWADAVDNGIAGFLHSVRDYREQDLFDVLVVVGPLRSSGYAALPPALGNAARFDSLVQFVWEGLADDGAFGVDPMLARLQDAEPQHPLLSTSEPAESQSTDSARPASIAQFSRVLKTFFHGGADPNAGGTGRQEFGQLDEISLFAPVSDSLMLRRALLVHTDDTHGMLSSPQAAVIVVDCKSSGENVFRRCRAAELIPGEMYIAWPDLGDINLGGAQAEDGAFSLRWKQRLTEALRTNSTELEVRLRQAGVELVGLHHRIRDWAQPARNVIPAPQRAVHLEALIRTLGIEDDIAGFPRPKRALWWRLAWREIARSRGQAIQVGIQQQDIIEDELLLLLNDSELGIAGRLCEEGTFIFEMPEDASLSGTVSFLNIERVEEGYRAPDHMLRMIIQLEDALEWRA